MKTLTSLQHPLVKHLVKLRESKGYREEQKRAFILGEKVIRQVENHVKIISLLSLSPTSLKSETSYIVTESILKKISGLSHPEPICAEVSLPPPSDLLSKKRLLGLDRIRDPGNMGTLLRTALAFGFEGAWLSPTCVDPFNDKAIRASKGASFILPIGFGEFSPWKEPLLIADLEGTPLDKLSLPPRFMLILGNESEGVDPSLNGEKVTLPMSGQIESLNVAVAGGIMMYKLWEMKPT